jgi:hypothetical protein
MGIGNKEYVGGLDCNGAGVTRCGKITHIGTDTSGTPGNATANFTAGISAIASGATTCVITSSFVTPLSRVTINWLGDHGATRSWVSRVSGAFTVNLFTAATANTSFCWTITEIANISVLNGLLHSWSLNGNSNDVFVTGNGTDTDISYVTGKLGQCASFNGTTSKIVTAALLKPLTWSMSCWINPSATHADYETAWSIGNPSVGVAYLNRAVSSNVWNLSNNSTNSITVTILPGVWSHVVVTFSGTTATGYTNNVVGTPVAQTIAESTGAIWFGQYVTGVYPSSSLIDDVAMWDRALTAGEVATLYNVTVGNAYPFYP